MSNKVDTSKKSKHYLESKDFYDETIKCQINGEISEKLARMFILLSERNANHRNFVRYTHIREDIILIGQLACAHAFKFFIPFKCKEASRKWKENPTPIEYHHEHCSNIFAFFTTCIRHDIIHFLKSEYKQSNIMNKKRISVGLDPSFGYVDMVKERERKEAIARGDYDFDQDDDESGYTAQVADHAPVEPSFNIY